MVYKLVYIFEIIIFMNIYDITIYSWKCLSSSFDIHRYFPCWSAASLAPGPGPPPSPRSSSPHPAKTSVQARSMHHPGFALPVGKKSTPRGPRARAGTARQVAEGPSESELLVHRQNADGRSTVLP